MTAAEPRPDKWGIALRVGIYVFMGIVGIWVFSWVLMFITASNPFLTSIFSVFCSAAVANAVSLRVYERGNLAEIGLGWTTASRGNGVLGVVGGAGAAILAIFIPIVLRMGDLSFGRPRWGTLIFISVSLVFGAVGEEMLFRGYAFQLLFGFLGPWATILPFSILFALAHLGNPNQSSPAVGWIALINTAFWGALLGYAFLRSQDLWLPIGLHFGWNWMLPLFGANLSGYDLAASTEGTMGLAGVGMRWHIADIWTGGAYGPEGGLLTTFILIGLAYFLKRAPIQKQVAPLVRPQEG